MLAETVAGKNFDFGLNWKSYSEKAFDPQKFEAARLSLERLLGRNDLTGKTFLDVGCGSGIFSAAARSLGADVTGIDISAHSVEASRQNAQKLGVSEGIRFKQADVLDETAVRALGTFDIVYAWGSLHHTGSLWQAIRRTADTVKPGGNLALAIYRNHWTAGAWKAVKKLYNVSPVFGQKILIGIFYPLIFVSKLLITGQNPKKMRRGMDFYHDVVDWVGGYPYEWASKDQVTGFLSGLNFERKAFFEASLPTGNHEYLFTRGSAA